MTVVKRYLQCNKRHYIDKDTFKFVSEAERVRPFETDVPFYFWNFNERDEHSVATGFESVGSKLQNVYSVYRRTYCLQLNKLAVSFTNGYNIALIKFFDTSLGGEITIEVNTNFNTVVTNARGRNRVKIIGVDHTLSSGSSTQKYHTKYGSGPLAEKLFARVPNHYFQEANGVGMFSYGIKGTQYPIEYKGKTLNGTCYALLCGSWAVLLGDDMTFDAIVSLSSVSFEKLCIERILYTTNTYLLKVMTLIK